MLPPAILDKVVEHIGRVKIWDGDTIDAFMTSDEIRDLAIAASKPVSVYYAVQMQELADVKEKLRRHLESGNFRRKYIVGASTAWTIADNILALHKVTREQLLEKETSIKFRRVRQEVYHAIYSTGRYGLKTIGKIMNRDHASILNGINRWDEILQKEIHHD